MRVSDALEQLEDIHAQLAKGEVYHGFRVPAVAVTGVLAVAAAAVQPTVVDAADPAGFVLFWVAVAAIGAALGSGSALHGYLVREDDFDRRRTRRVFAQFLPAVAAGGVVTLVFRRAGVEFIPLLPGLWAVLFGVGLISARPYLPRGVGWVGLFYFVAGCLLLARGGSELSGWSVGGVFGPGHFAAAWVLWRGRERDG